MSDMPKVIYAYARPQEQGITGHDDEWLAHEDDGAAFIESDVPYYRYDLLPQWRPISGAPKDEWIIAGERGFDGLIYKLLIIEFPDNREPLFIDDRGKSQELNENDVPPHWMPLGTLPEPPKGDE